MDFYQISIEEVNAEFTSRSFVANYHNGIGFQEGNDVSFLNHAALDAAGFTAISRNEFSNGSVTLHISNGENQNSHYADPYVAAVTNAAGTLLCGKMRVSE